MLLAFLGAGSAAFGARFAFSVFFFVLAAFLLAVEANLACNLCQPGECAEFAEASRARASHMAVIW